MGGGGSDLELMGRLESKFGMMDGGGAALIERHVLASWDSIYYIVDESYHDDI